MTSFEATAVRFAPPDRSPTARRRQRLIEDHLPLVRSIARRFADRGERFEDLVQVGSIGLIGAVDRCDPERASALSAYAARCVEGEIRRHLRDRCSVVRIPRRAREELALAAAARPPLPLEQEMELPAVVGRQALDEQSLARAMVASAARSLDGRERHLVALRYYGDLSQAEIGAAVGISQVHVSRLLRGAIAKMRDRLDPDAG
jgi:RNA polymerase sigma-B factor